MPFHVTALSPLTLLVQLPSGDRLLVNCAAGTTRLASEHKLRAADAKLRAVLVTSTSWRHVGGLCDVIYEVPVVEKGAANGPENVSNGSARLRVVGGNSARLLRLFLALQSTLWRPQMLLEFPEPSEENVLTFGAGANAVTVLTLALKRRSGQERSENVLASTLALDFSTFRGAGAQLSARAAEPFLAGEEGEEAADGDDDDDDRDACSFVFVGAEQAGKFDARRAMELGVPKGPLFKQLVGGSDVELPDGTTVRSADVVSAPPPRLAFAIFDCQTESHVHCLWEKAQQQQQQQQQESGGDSRLLLGDFRVGAKLRLQFIIHLTPPAVAATSVYQDLCRLFFDPGELGKSGSSFHRYWNTTPPVSVLTTSDTLRSSLRDIEPELFGRWEQETRLSSGDATAEKEKAPGNALLPMETLSVPSHATPNNKMTGRSAIAPRTVFLPEKEENDNGEWAIFLGTSGSAATKTRGESALLVKAPRGFVLVDCGEGTWPQMVRALGDELAREVLRNLTAILVTHKHPDHLRGILEILTERRDVLGLPTGSGEQPKEDGANAHSKAGSIRRRATHACTVCRATFHYESSLAAHRFIHEPDTLVEVWERAKSVISNEDDLQLLRCADFLPAAVFEPAGGKDGTLVDDEGSVVVSGPFWVDTLLQDYSHVEPLFYHFVDAFELTQGTGKDGAEGLPGTPNYLLAERTGFDVQAVCVIHSYPSFAFIMSSDEWTLCFSGDTRPCEELKDAMLSRKHQRAAPTVLVHESNFGDSMREKAMSDRHSTVSEALLVGARAEVDLLVLTHFGRRIEKRTPEIPEQGFEIPMVCPAFDFMRLTPARAEAGEANCKFWASFSARCASQFGTGIDQEMVPPLLSGKLPAEGTSGGQKAHAAGKVARAAKAGPPKRTVAAVVVQVEASPAAEHLALVRILGESTHGQFGQGEAHIRQMPPLGGDVGPDVTLARALWKGGDPPLEQGDVVAVDVLAEEAVPSECRNRAVRAQFEQSAGVILLTTCSAGAAAEASVFGAGISPESAGTKKAALDDEVVDDFVLLVCAVGRNSKAPTQWGFPKGHLEPEDEGSAFEAALRELEEETGVVAVGTHYSGAFSLLSADDSVALTSLAMGSEFSRRLIPPIVSQYSFERSGKRSHDNSGRPRRIFKQTSFFVMRFDPTVAALPSMMLQEGETCIVQWVPVSAAKKLLRKEDLCSNLDVAVRCNSTDKRDGKYECD